jgi:hypothetical protein
MFISLTHNTFFLNHEYTKKKIDEFEFLYIYENQNYT